MKLLEQTPKKYDRGMRVLTLGRINKIKRTIADMVDAGQDILEIGSGTGVLAAMMSQRGGRVLGVDTSDKMLTFAREQAPDVEFLHMTAVEIDRLAPRQFDLVVSTLCFSELTDPELSHTLTAIQTVLRPGGRLILADEVRPKGWGRRILAGVVRLPLAALTFALTQNTTHALVNIKDRLSSAGYSVAEERRYLLGTLVLLVAERA